MKRNRRGLACLYAALLVATGADAWASSKKFEGILVAVGATDAKSGRTMITIRGVEHYGQDYEIKDRSFHISPNAQYVLDGQLVPRAVGLQPGRRIYTYGSNGGLKYVVVLSAATFAPAGRVAKVEGGVCTLELPLGPSFLPWPVQLTGTPADNLKPGHWARITPARPQTIALLSPAAQRQRIHGLGKAYDAVFLPPAAGAAWTLAVRKEAGVETVAFTGKGNSPQPIVDAHVSAGSEMLATPGRPAVVVYMVHGDGKPDGEALVVVRDVAGRVYGQVKAVAADQATISVWDGAKDNEVIVPIAADAVVNLDGQPVKVDAIQAGQTALVLPARPQQVEAIEPTAPVKGH
jgi:hypothetical protein